MSVNIRAESSILALASTPHTPLSNSLISSTKPLRERTPTGAQHFASFKGGKSGPWMC